MGNSQSTVSKEGEGHAELFYTGFRAVQEGRFTVAEIYFLQVLRKHPGAAFWSTIMAAVAQKPSTEAVSDTASPREQGLEKAADVGTEVGDPPNPTGGAHTQESAFPTDAPAAATPASMEETAAGSDGADKEDTKADATAFALRTKVVDVLLPLNENLVPIMDYVRLLADMSHTYLRVLPTTENPEKVIGLAARYCLFGVSHTQALLHCLALWKEEKFGDGGGFIDYKKTRHLQFGGRDVVGDFSSGVESDAGESSGGSSSAAGQKWRTLDRTSSLLFTLALLESRLRYYNFSCLVNYSTLLIRVATDSKEGRKQKAVLQNAAEHVEALFVSVSDLAKEYPNEYISQIVLAHVPQSASAGRDLLSSMGNSSHRSNQVSLALGSDDNRRLFASGAPWTPTQSGLVSLMATLHVSLSVQEVVSRATQAQICSPAQRLSYHYTLWNYSTEVTVLSGCSLFLLKRSLPGFVPGKSTLAHQTLLQQNRSGSEAPGLDAAAAVRESEVQQPVPADDDVATTAEMRRKAAKAAAKRDAAVKKMEAKLTQKRRTVNTDLSLCDERTCVVLCLEEAAVLAIPALFLKAVLCQMSDETDEVADSLRHLKAVTVGLHGPDSAEWVLISSIVRSTFGDDWG